MNTYILLTQKAWHNKLFEDVKNIFPDFRWILINTKENFNIENIKKINPDKIFVPHWSYIIDGKIYENYECIVFHMTDLPFGRGGSPLQNLIVRGIEDTKITALRVSDEIDAGDVYLKRDLNLNGTAEEIFIRSSKIIFEMIQVIINDDIKPEKQIGEITCFKRRKPSDSAIMSLTKIEDVYDYIRMLDAEGYPRAFYENENLKFEFSRASLKSDNTIIADVRIIQK